MRISIQHTNFTVPGTSRTTFCDPRARKSVSTFGRPKTFAVLFNVLPISLYRSSSFKNNAALEVP